jgi:hypothetical protein
MADELNEWMSGYRRAWQSNDPDDIRGLFTEDALYRVEPWSEPWRGQDAIVENWLARRDEPETTTFSWSALVVTDDIAVVQGETVYVSDATYSNLWVIRLDADGRATEFTEWWMDQARPS